MCVRDSLHYALGASNQRHAVAAQVGKSYSGPREALRLTGKFVLTHLLDGAKTGGAAAPDLASSPFVLGLHQEVPAIHSFP